MARTWGETIAEGYGSGRAIGNDVAALRFNRRAEKLRAGLEERAAAEGKDLSEYAGELEAGLRQAAIDVGASRRGLSSAEDAYAAMAPGLQRGSARRAGALAMGGDQAGARDALSRGAYGRGEFDTGQEQQIAGDTIRATTGALGADGQYDSARGAQALAGTAARYGDAGAAAQQQGAANSFRLQAAVAKADSLFNMAQDLGKFSNDQIVGAWAGIQQNVPELAGVRVQKGDDNKLYIYTNDQPSGLIDPADPADMDELAGMLRQFTNAPGDSLNTHIQTRIKLADERRKRGTDIADKFNDAYIDVAKKLADEKGIPADVSNAIISAHRKISDGTGGSVKFQEIGDEPNSYVLDVGGKLYVAKTNVEPNLEAGQPGGALQIFDADTGAPVPATALDRQQREAITTGIADIAAATAKTNYQLRAGAIGDAFSVLNSLEQQAYDREGLGGRAAPRAGGGARGERNNNTGNIRDVGQFKGNPDYIGPDDKGFAQFRTPEAGQQAFTTQLQRYMRGEGVAGRPRTTVGDIVSLWSPQSDPGNAPGSTDNYTRYVAQRLGVSPDAPLTEADIPRLSAAMAEFENGNTARGVLPADPSGVDPAQRRAPVTAVASAPTPRTPPRAQALPERLRAGAQTARSAATNVRTAREALERFDREQGVRQGAIGGATGSYLSGTRATGMNDTQRRVRAQLVADVERAERQARQSVLASRDDVREARTQQDRAADADLYAKYGGAADFWSRAK